jgi:hypothetical protein
MESGNKINPQDSQYATAFWVRMKQKGDAFVASMREAMKSPIESAIKTIGPNGEGQFAIFVTPEGMTDEERQKISAYREIAREMGYQIGPLKRNERSGTSTGIIRKL